MSFVDNLLKKVVDGFTGRMAVKMDTRTMLFVIAGLCIVLAFVVDDKEEIEEPEKQKPEEIK